MPARIVDDIHDDAAAFVELVDDDAAAFIELVVNVAVNAFHAFAVFVGVVRYIEVGHAAVEQLDHSAVIVIIIGDVAGAAEKGQGRLRTRRSANSRTSSLLAADRGAFAQAAVVMNVSLKRDVEDAVRPGGGQSIVGARL